MTGLCENRVIIITGAGGGLGAAYAKAFAAEGAAVLVNDINAAAATEIVADITKAGGRAVVNTANITDFADAEHAVVQALETFGDLHVVVNNAGICRDRMFVSMTEQAWDQVISVHLKGHFCISRHAVEYWRNQVKSRGRTLSARIINTSSGAGLNGSIGQSNYGAAKAGIATLTLNQAAELARYGITANALAPAARTGMTEDVFADMMQKPADDAFDYYAPANVAPLVVWLGSEYSQKVTGRIFEVAGGKISIADGWRSTSGLDKGARWQVSELSDAIERLMADEVAAQKVYGA